MQPAHPILSGPQLVVMGPWLLMRALEDLHRMVELADDANSRLVAIESQATAMQGQLDAAIQIGNEVLGVGRKIEKSARSILSFGDRFDSTAADLIAEGKLLQQRAREVADRTAEVIGALPVLEQALAMSTPIEGALERLARLTELLPRAAPITKR